MRTLIAVTAVVWTLVIAAAAAAAPGGAEVVHQNSCEAVWFGTVCTTIKATTNVVATPSGNVHYATNGTAERQLTFFFGGSYTTTSDIHLTSLQKKGDLHVVSERSTQTTSYRSGTYALDCAGTIVSHYANGSTQYVDYSYDCTIPTIP
jgi:hypothetical protein